MYKHFFCLVTLLCSFFFSSQLCAEPPNIERLKDDLIRYHDSGAYFTEIQQVADHAEKHIEHEVSINLARPHPQKLAIVLDIDETSLSNFINMKATRFGSTSEQIKQQLLAANERPIQPILNLYKKAQAQNIAVFFLTGRDTSLKQATIKNLRNAGYLTWTDLYFRSPTEPTVAYKTQTRKKIMAQGYTIIASIGDQKSDLIGGYAQKTYKLPNPYYYIP